MTQDQNKDSKIPTHSTPVFAEDFELDTIAQKLLEEGQLGPFKLKGIIGQGAMGVVFLAEQSQPIQRLVALKIIQSGAATKDVVKRFKLEQQSLALMKHESIASVYESGVFKTGLPYFSMEYVNGPHITDFCDQERYTVNQRIHLFIRVCQAMQHAHQKGILHRDIKPSNVLVSVEDQSVLPKIIDFGIAKAITDEDVRDTRLTQAGGIVGTPIYMSPEQAAGMDLDTRSDVYSLAMLLYEMLVGYSPFDEETFSKANLLYQVYLVQKGAIEKPSVRLKSLQFGLDKLAQGRKTTPRHLVQMIQGDLDHIISKGLAKKREDRYNSMSDLMSDLDAYLNNQPIAEAKGNKWVRVTKFARRHRMGVTLVALLFVTLVLGFVGTTLGWRKALDATEKANQEAAKANQIAQFLEGIFEVSDPDQARGKTVTARELLEKGSQRIGEDLKGQHDVQAQMMQMMAKIYWKLGMYDESAPLLESTQDLWRAHLDVNSLEYSAVLKDFSDQYRLTANFEKAEETAKQALEIRRRHPEAGYGKIAESLQDLAVCYYEWGHYEEAERFYRQSLDIHEGDPDSDPRPAAHVHNGLAITLSTLDRGDEAEPHHFRALEIREKYLDPNHPDLGQSYMNVGLILEDKNEDDKAEAYYLRALRIWKNALGPDHMRVGIVNVNLGDFYRKRARPKDAEVHFKRALELFEKSLGMDHPYVAYPLGGLSQLYLNVNRLDEAERMVRRAIEIRDLKFPENHGLKAGNYEVYRDILKAQNRLDEAETMQKKLDLIAEGN